MTPKQEAALREYLQESIVPLIEQVLVKKLGQAMSFAAEQLIQPKPAQQQKPVAWMFEGIKFDGTKHGPHLVWKPEYMDAMSANMGAVAAPLYTTPQPAVPDGWKLVPVEPTEAMLRAMDECSTEGYDERLLTGHAWSVYTAAIDAAPQHGIKGDA